MRLIAHDRYNSDTVCLKLTDTKVSFNSCKFKLSYKMLPWIDQNISSVKIVTNLSLIELRKYFVRTVARICFHNLHAIYIIYFLIN